MSAVIAGDIKHTVNWANHYASLGWKLVPILAGTKGPSGSESMGWNLPGNTWDGTTPWDEGFTNVGLAHGHSHTVAIDFDQVDKAIALFRDKYFIDLESYINKSDAIRITSGRTNRDKLLYKIPVNDLTAGRVGMETIQFKDDDDGAMILELRSLSRKGLTMQDVLPPSIHPTTLQPYRWVGTSGERLGLMPELPADLMSVWLSEVELRVAGREARVRTTGAMQPLQGMWQIEEIKDALGWIDPSGYDTWLQMGMALHHRFGGSDVGWQVFDWWSQRDGVGYQDESATMSKWDSFDSMGDSDGYAVTILTVFKSARVNGWTGWKDTGFLKANEMLAGLNITMMPAVHEIADVTGGQVVVSIDDIAESIRYSKMDTSEQFHGVLDVIVNSDLDAFDENKLLDVVKEVVKDKRLVNSEFKKLKGACKKAVVIAIREKAMVDSISVADGSVVGTGAVGHGGVTGGMGLKDLINHNSFPDILIDDETGIASVKATWDNTAYLLCNYGVYVSYNQITKQPSINHAEFSSEGVADTSHEDAITEVISLMRRNMLVAGFGDNTIVAHLGRISSSNQYNPVVGHLSSVVWDGVDRLGEFFGLIDVTEGSDKYRDYVVRKWLIQACAAADGAENTPLRHTGAGAAADGSEVAKPKYEYVMVFQGDQGLAKTKFLGNMLPAVLRRYFKEGILIDPSAKDSRTSFIQNWICELGELDATFTRSDISHLKGFLSEESDVYRKPYARVDSSYKRRTCACASVNPKQFLKDSTGNRRFWTLPVVGLRLPDEASVDLDQLWAQVWSLYIGGEPWWPSTEWQKYIDMFAQTNLYLTEKEDDIFERLKWYFGEFDQARIDDGQVMFAKDIADILNRDKSDKTVSAREVGRALSKVNRDKDGEPRVHSNTHGSFKWKVPQFVGRPVTGMN